MSTYRVTFKGTDNKTFFSELRASVDQYFTTTKQKKTGNSKLFFKAILITAIGPILYLSGLLQPWGVGISYLIFGVLGLFHALAGFNIMHDANHGSFSSNPKVNKIVGNIMSLLGTHAFIWKTKHNVVHHTFTNVDEVDDDIAKWPIMRMSPTQKRLKHHAFQSIYMWPLYAISSLFWIYMNDFGKYFTGKVYTTNLPKFPRSEKMIFWFTKLGYFIVYGAIPIFALGWLHGILVLVTMHAALGIGLSVVFQLAHVVEQTDFVKGSDEGHTLIENEWAVHQIATTADFSVKSKVWTWLLGGLNFQVEHHLFPQISHVHYPALHAILKQKCEEFGIKLNVYPTFASALTSHVRHMHYLGVR